MPIKAITEFVRYLNNVNKSPCTVKSYAYCLKLFWDYLADKQLNWKTINLASLAGFVGWLRQSKAPAQVIDLHEIQEARKPATINVILGCLSSFYRFHNQLGNSDVKVTEAVNLPNNRYKALLHHVYKNKPSQRRIVSVKQVRQPPKTITKDQFIQLRNACTNYRDKFLVCLLYETGIRIGQALSLRDGDGDLLLRVNEQKLKRIRLIPISKECINAIKSQQNVVLSDEVSKYLFPSHRASKTPTASAAHINRSLKNLAVEHGIKDTNGVIWKFSSHQFRHTIGTQMINVGVPQVMVQHYLGHESPEMTARYAHIHNETMKKAFTEYQEKMVDVNGRVKANDELINAKWLKKNIMSQALPNGLCSLPLTQNRCPHANACLTCTHFRTSKQYLERHKTQLEETIKVIENAKQNGWHRIEEMNNEVAGNLKSIIFTLENADE